VSATDVAIVDSGGANLASLRHALARLGATCTVTSEPARIAAATHVLLPGVGAAGEAMARLRSAGLVDCIRALSRPLLGICLGLQLLYEHCEEGRTGALGILPGEVTRLQPAAGLPVPHTGWNTCRRLRDDPLFEGVAHSEYFYFVHAYAAAVDASTTAATDYGRPLTAAAWRDNFHGVQFHPERSAAAGARVLANFLAL
jgi:glutamine amidotransferase